MENIIKIIELINEQPTGIHESKITPEILSLVRENSNLFYRLDTASGAFWMLSNQGVIFAQNNKLRSLERRLTHLESEIVSIRQEMKRGADSAFS